MFCLKNQRREPEDRSANNYFLVGLGGGAGAGAGALGAGTTPVPGFGRGLKAGAREGGVAPNVPQSGDIGLVSDFFFVMRFHQVDRCKN